MNIAKTINVIAAKTVASPIGSKIAEGLLNLYNILVKICLPVAAVAIAYSAFKMFGGSEQEANKAKSTLVRIVIGIGLVLAAPYIAATVSEWFQGMGGSEIWM